MGGGRSPTGTVVVVTLLMIVGAPALGALLPEEEPEPPMSLDVPELGSDELATPTTTVPALPLFGAFDSDPWGPEGTCYGAELYEEVPCEQPHEREVFHRSRFEGPYLGPVALQSAGDRACEEAYAGRTGESAIRNGVLVEAAIPSATAWEDEQREVVCLAVTAQTTGSVLDG